MSTAREMTLDEWVDRLPTDHRARHELADLRAQVEELQFYKKGWDAVIEASEASASVHLHKGETCRQTAALLATISEAKALRAQVDRLTAERDEARKDATALVVLLRDAGVHENASAGMCGTRAWSIRTRSMCERNPLHGDRICDALARHTPTEST